MSEASDILNHLKSLANPVNVDGMARFGIRPKTTVLGISVNTLRQIAKPHRKNHTLAAQLWVSRIHEARILASIIDDPKQVTEAQMEVWASAFDTWDICDQCCGNLFARTPFAWDKAAAWAVRNEEFVKRAGFVLMAYLTHRTSKAPDLAYLPFLALIDKQAGDDRNFVKKAVNWALRDIGKRNLALNALAIECANKIHMQESKAARWIAKDALRELQSDKVQARLKDQHDKLHE